MTHRAVPLGALSQIVSDDTLSRSELRAILRETFYNLATHPSCGSERKAYEWIKERIPSKDWPFVRPLLPTATPTGRRGRLKNSHGEAAHAKDLKLYDAFCRARTEGMTRKQFIERLAGDKFTGQNAFEDASMALRRAIKRLPEPERVAIEVTNEIRVDRLIWNADGGKRSLERLHIRSKDKRA